MIVELWCKGDVSANALALSAQYPENSPLVALMYALFSNESMWEVYRDTKRVDDDPDNAQENVTDSQFNDSALTGRYWIESMTYAAQEFTVQQTMDVSKGTHLAVWSKSPVDKRRETQGENGMQTNDDVLPVPT